MVLYVTETIRLIRGVEKGGGGKGYRGGGRGKLYTYRYTVTTRIIKMDSDESQTNVS